MQLFLIKHRSGCFLQARSQSGRRKSDLPRVFNTRSAARRFLAGWVKGDCVRLFEQTPMEGDGYWYLHYIEGTQRKRDEYIIVEFDCTPVEDFSPYPDRIRNKRMLNASKTERPAQEHLLGSAVRNERDVLAEQKE